MFYYILKNIFFIKNFYIRIDFYFYLNILTDCNNNYSQLNKFLLVIF